MKFITLFTVVTLTGICAYGQNLIGLNDREIRKYMKEYRSEMSFNNVTNNKFLYLKYSDSSDSQTLLFFLNPDSVCRSIRMICDVSVKAEKVKEFDSIYKKSSENRWIDNKEGKDYLIEIRDEMWSCIITIKPDN
jgi:hypothetical protein